MKTVDLIVSKGPDDYGCWLKDFKGIYGAGITSSAAVDNLKSAIDLYIKHNADAPGWLKNCAFNIIHSK